jgi:hypothetical protein
VLDHSLGIITQTACARGRRGEEKRRKGGSLKREKVKKC